MTRPLLQHTHTHTATDVRLHSDPIYPRDEVAQKPRQRRPRSADAYHFSSLASLMLASVSCSCAGGASCRSSACICLIISHVSMEQQNWRESQRTKASCCPNSHNGTRRTSTIDDRRKPRTKKHRQAHFQRLRLRYVACKASDRRYCGERGKSQTAIKSRMGLENEEASSLTATARNSAQ